MKNFYLIFVCICIFFTFQVIAEKPAVVTNYSIHSAINDKHELSIDYFKEIKINFPAGKKFLNEYIFYSSQKVKNLKVTIYDANHQMVRVLKNSEIKDESAYSHYLYEDDRVKIIKPYYNSFPFYVTYEYTIIADEFISLPQWSPLSPDNMPVLESSYVLSVPSNFKYNYKFYNCNPDSSSVENVEERTRYAWYFNQLNPVEELKNSTSVRYRMPKGIFVPEHFVFAGLPGSFENWSTYGSWISKLLIGKNDIPEFEIHQIEQLTKDCNNDLEIIQAIYNYMLKSTRYVNVVIGAGGLVPYPASYVSSNKYGDCKALVNYTHSLLKSVGIESYFSLIKAGNSNPYIDPGLIYQTFNHVVLCVPIENDTLWLECTPNENIFGYVSSYIDDKYVLVCCGKDSYLTKTPNSSCQQNRTELLANVVLESETLTATIERNLHGIPAENLNYGISFYQGEKLESWLEFKLPYHHFEIQEVSFDISDSIQSVYEKSKISFNNHVIGHDGKIYIEPIHTILDYNLKDKRYFDAGFFVKNNYSIIDTMLYTIPLECDIHSSPSTDTIYSDFGTYSQVSFTDGNHLQIIKSLSLNKGIYRNENFTAIKDFIEVASQFDHQKIILNKNGE